MVDVEQRTLRTFEQHPLAGLAQIDEQGRHVIDHRLDVLTEGQRIREHLLDVDGVSLQPVLQHEVVIRAGSTQFLGKLVRIEQVGNTDAAPGHLVFVGRTDTAPGGADGLVARCTLARLIDGDVVRHDQRRRRRNFQARTHFHTLRLEFGDLRLQGCR